MTENQTAAQSAVVVAEDEPDYGAGMSDEELDALLVREVTIDGMCGVY